MDFNDIKEKWKSWGFAKKAGAVCGCCIALIIIAIVFGFIIPDDYQMDDMDSESISMDDLIINATTVVKYGEISKDSNHVWVSESTGEYAEDAYSAPWTLSSTINIDLEKMYDYIRHKSLDSSLDSDRIDTKDGYIDNFDNQVDVNDNEYLSLPDDFTFNEFKNYLIKENGKEPIKIMQFELKDDAGSTYDVHDSEDISYKINNKSNVLTIYYKCDSTQLKTNDTAQVVDIIKNATSCDFDLVWSISTNKTASKNDNSDEVFSKLRYQDYPVTVRNIN